MKNKITNFIEKNFKTTDIDAVLLDENMKMKVLKAKEVKNKIKDILECENINVFEAGDENFVVVIDRDALDYSKRINLLAYSIFEFSFYGKVLLVRKRFSDEKSERFSQRM